MDAYLYILFLLTGFSMAYSPGPSVIYTVMSTLRFGRSDMLARVIGQIVALVFYGTVSLVGIRALMVRFPNFIPLLTFIGALYLAYIAISSLRDLGSAMSVSAGSVERCRTPPFIAFREAFFVGLTNPKIMLVYCVIIPQFASTEHDITFQMAVMILSQWVIKGSSLVFFVFLADRLRVLIDHPNIAVLVTKGFAVLLLGISAYISLRSIRILIAEF